MGLLKDRKSTNNVVARSRSIDADAQVMSNIAKRFDSVVCIYMPVEGTYIDIHIMFFSAEQNYTKLQLTAYISHTSPNPNTQLCRSSIYGKDRIGCGL